MMTYGFVVSTSDLSYLRQHVFVALKSEPIVCSSSQEIDKLHQADAIYFVASSGSMHSTAYQELVLTALDSVSKRHDCQLLLLGNVTIPLGFGALGTLPEKLPDGLKEVSQ